MTIGEMSGNVLMDLTVMADEVIGPLLCNPENQKGWPKIVKNDMKRHVNELRNLMHQVIFDINLDTITFLAWVVLFVLPHSLLPFYAFFMS